MVRSRVDIGVYTKHLNLKQRKSPNSTSLALSRLKIVIDIKHIVNNPKLYEKSCLDRNYEKQSQYPFEIARLYKERGSVRGRVIELQKSIKTLETQLQRGASQGKGDEETRDSILGQARELKARVREEIEAEASAAHELHQLASQLPNFTSEFTPIGKEPTLLGYINPHLAPFPASPSDPAPSTASAPVQEEQHDTLQTARKTASPKTISPTRTTISHVEIGRRLDLLNFDASSQSSGWGFYFLQHGAALLEQALIQYALHLCTRAPHAFIPITPPSIVYSDVAAAAGYMPRDANNERQTYTLMQTRKDVESGKRELTLAGTAEIPFAAMHSNSILSETDMPKAVVGPSRCYRAEAGARGADTKGLYRVHEFTKVEMFGWTLPTLEASLDLFQTMLDIQMEFYRSLGLRCRVLEMPSTDLGASAMRKIDIEAYFPGRKHNTKGPWGEVSSLSLCGDYQSRRMVTRFKRVREGKAENIYPWTVNGTACAVPRVLAALLETGWDGKRKVVRIPEVLWGYMGGIKEIEPPMGRAQDEKSKGERIEVDNSNGGEEGEESSDVDDAEEEAKWDEIREQHEVLGVEDGREDKVEQTKPAQAR